MSLKVTLVTAQCLSAAQPQTEVSPIVRTPIATIATTSPAIPIDRAAEGPAYRVVTINY